MKPYEHFLPNYVPNLNEDFPDDIIENFEIDIPATPEVEFEEVITQEF